MDRPRLLSLATLLALLTTPAPARAAATRGFVLTTDYTSGTVSVVDLATRVVTCDVADVSPDPVGRWYQGSLYVVNRYGYDNVQVIAPAQGYATVRQFSVGNGTNPQDIAFASRSKAYVSRLGSPDLLIVNPSTGASLGTIGLAAWADADGNPEAAHLAVVGNLLFVALERLANFVPADTGLVVVVDMRADTVYDVDPLTAGKQVVRLSGLNPSTAFAAVPGGGAPPELHLYIGCTGQWGLLDGGIEDIVVPTQGGAEPWAVRSAGFAITEVALGGDVVDVAGYGPERSYAIVADLSSNTSLVSWDPATGTKLATLYVPGGFSLSDAALDDRRELYVCNGSFGAPGLRVFRADDGTPLAGPLPVCLPPVQIVFDQESDLAAVGEPALTEGFTLAGPVPNPTHLSARLALGMRAPCVARVEIFDLGGRRVRTLADGSFPRGTTDLVWDLSDGIGRRVPPGVYLARALTSGATVTRRFVVL